jgi:hypothetical protein
MSLVIARFGVFGIVQAGGAMVLTVCFLELRLFPTHFCYQKIKMYEQKKIIQQNMCSINYAGQRTRLQATLFIRMPAFVLSICGWT